MTRSRWDVPSYGLPERPVHPRFGETNPSAVYRGRLAGPGEFFSQQGSLFTESGVQWSQRDIEVYEDIEVPG